MKDIGFILIVSTILWLLVDWLKPIWEASGASRYISMAVAAVGAAALVTAAGLLLGTVAMVDYFGAGVVTVLVFYFFREKRWWCRLGQAVCLYILNVQMLGGYYYAIPIGGYELQLVQQGLALLALIPIWLYDGRQGYHSRGFRWFCYAFYPLHMLLLYFLWQLAI